MTTSTADYKYILKELGGGPSVWALECYPQTQQLPFISDTGCMYIRFKPDTSEERAEEIRQLLNECAENITVID